MDTPQRQVKIGECGGDDDGHLLDDRLGRPPHLSVGKSDPMSVDDRATDDD
jgi:hypothetical protein